MRIWYFCIIIFWVCRGVEEGKVESEKNNKERNVTNRPAEDINNDNKKASWAKCVRDTRRLK